MTTIIRLTRNSAIAVSHFLIIIFIRNDIPNTHTYVLNLQLLAAEKTYYSQDCCNNIPWNSVHNQKANYIINMTKTSELGQHEYLFWSLILKKSLFILTQSHRVLYRNTLFISFYI